MDKNCLIVTEKLGEGTFGTVYKATTTKGLEINNIIYKSLAVKMIKGTVLSR